VTNPYQPPSETGDQDKAGSSVRQPSFFVVVIASVTIAFLCAILTGWIIESVTGCLLAIVIAMLRKWTQLGSRVGP
jgi:hypothetical protein